MAQKNFEIDSNFSNKRKILFTNILFETNIVIEKIVLN